METMQFHIAQMGLFSGQYCFPISGGPTKQFDAHEKFTWGRKASLIRPLVTKNLNAFTFDI